MKRQRMTIGGIIKIPLSENRFALGKILEEGFVVVYRKTTNASELGSTDLSIITSSGELVFAILFNDIITKGLFEIIEKSIVSDDELKKIPPQYHIETLHPELCTIIYNDNSERKALPSECVGMDYMYIWEAPSFVELIEDRLAGRSNKYEELKKKELEQGIAIEKELGMKIPREWWKYNPETEIMGYNSLIGHPPSEWRQIIEASGMSK